jgi:predicted metal-dependent hydrolase
MRFLVRFLPSETGRQVLLETVKSTGKAVGVAARNPKWTSRGSLEIDVFAPAKADFLLFLAVVEPLGSVEHWRDLNVAPPHLEKEQLVSEARSYFNAERYWECHETLESLWRVLTGDEKSLVQAIILVCAAYVHHQKSEDEVAIGVLKRALPGLHWTKASYLGIDVVALRRRVSDTLATESISIFTI